MPDPADPRLAPLAEEHWSPQLRPVLESLDPVLDVHRVMAHHPDLLAAWSPIRNHVTGGGTLEPRHREIVILRIAHLAGSAYQWHHHVVRGRQAGLAEDEIVAIRRPSPQGWPEAEAALITAADELLADLTITDPTWDALGRALSVPQILDLVVTAGLYVTLAMVIAATGVQIET